MYYETDGDSGYYAIRLFSTKWKAEKYRDKLDDAYGRVKSIEIDADEDLEPFK